MFGDKFGERSGAATQGVVGLPGVHRRRSFMPDNDEIVRDPDVARRLCTATLPVQSIGERELIPLCGKARGNVTAPDAPVARAEDGSFL